MHITNNSMKITEKQLREIVKESISTKLNEYKFGDSMPDKMYIRPNGENNIAKLPNWYSKEPGKRALSNSQYIDSTTGKNVQTPVNYAGMFSHGKSKLCSQALTSIEKILGVSWGTQKTTGKIEWTEKELELIKNIYRMFGELARLTKEEGNKKRGYESQQ